MTNLKQIHSELLRLAAQVAELTGESSTKEVKVVKTEASVGDRPRVVKRNTWFLGGKKIASPELREKAMAAITELEKTMRLTQIGRKAGFANAYAVHGIKSTGRMGERSAKAILDLYEKTSK